MIDVRQTNTCGFARWSLLIKAISCLSKQLCTRIIRQSLPGCVLFFSLIFCCLFFFFWKIFSKDSWIFSRTCLASAIIKNKLTIRNILDGLLLPRFVVLRYRPDTDDGDLLKMVENIAQSLMFKTVHFVLRQHEGRPEMVAHLFIFIFFKCKFISI